MHFQYLVIYHSEDELWLFKIVVFNLESHWWLNMSHLHMLKERKRLTCMTIGGLGAECHTGTR